MYFVIFPICPECTSERTFRRISGTLYHISLVHQVCSRQRDAFWREMFEKTEVFENNFSPGVPLRSRCTRRHHVALISSHDRSMMYKKAKRKAKEGNKEKRSERGDLFFDQKKGTLAVILCMTPSFGQIIIRVSQAKTTSKSATTGKLVVDTERSAQHCRRTHEHILHFLASSHRHLSVIPHCCCTKTVV